MKDVSFVLAFSAGLVSFLSPCVLPLVPAYLTYLSGSSIEQLEKGEEKLKLLRKSILFTLGFSTIFIIMGLSFTSISKILFSYQVLFRLIGGIIIIVFGIHTMGLVKIKNLYREKRLVGMDKLSSNASPFFMGMAFASGWTPCVGPILASILIYAGSSSTILKGVILLAMYSLGLAIPFIFAAMLIESLGKSIKKMAKHFQLISILSGIIIIIMGILTITNKISLISSFFNSLLK